MKPTRRRWLVMWPTPGGPQYIEKHEGGSTWSSSNPADARRYPLWLALLVSAQLAGRTRVVSAADGVTGPARGAVAALDNGRAVVQLGVFLLVAVVMPPCRLLVDWVADLAQIPAQSPLRFGASLFALFSVAIITQLVVGQHAGRLALAYERWRGRLGPPVRVYVVVPGGAFGGPAGILGQRVAVDSELTGTVVEAEEIAEGGSMRLVIELPPGSGL